MAKESMKAREVKRAKLVAKYAAIAKLSHTPLFAFVSFSP